MNNIVIIEDEALLSKNLKHLLEENNFTVTCFDSAEAFINARFDEARRVYVVDANLPGIGGADVVKLIRFRDKISPIFMMSGDSTSDKVKQGLSYGADDYLSKPFEIDHFLLKITNSYNKALMINTELSNIVKLPKVHSIAREGVKVKLTANEYYIIASLLDSQNNEQSRSDLISASNNPIINLRTIDVHIHSIRKKIEKLGISIECIRGHGYKLIT